MNDSINVEGLRDTLAYLHDSRVFGRNQTHYDKNLK